MDTIEFLYLINRIESILSARKENEVKLKGLDLQ